MIRGIGTDIVEIARIAKLMDNRHFIERILTVEEQAILDSRPIPEQWLAGRFAAKEAVAKALGVGLHRCPPNYVQVLYDDNGAPTVELFGTAYQSMHDLGIKRVHLSISHEANYAVAMAVAEDI